MDDRMKKQDLYGLANVNVELTSRCNKNCWMCGRRKVERDYPELALKYGDMDFRLVRKIARQLPPNVVVQLHNNGEALLYPRFGDAVKLFRRASDEHRHQRKAPRREGRRDHRPSRHDGGVGDRKRP